jgi:hypothetical protein
LWGALAPLINIVDDGNSLFVDRRAGPCANPQVAGAMVEIAGTRPRFDTPPLLATTA